MQGEIGQIGLDDAPFSGLPQFRGGVAATIDQNLTTGISALIGRHAAPPICEIATL